MHFRACLRKKLTPPRSLARRVKRKHRVSLPPLFLIIRESNARRLSIAKRGPKKKNVTSPIRYTVEKYIRTRRNFTQFSHPYAYILGVRYIFILVAVKSRRLIRRYERENENLSRLATTRNVSRMQRVARLWDFLLVRAPTTTVCARNGERRSRNFRLTPCDVRNLSNTY